jgi:hypothetical protein
MNPELPIMTARFVVSGMQFSPHDCTQQFGVEPTNVLTKGDTKPKWKGPVPQSSWGMETKKSRFNSTDAPLQLLLAMIWPRRERIRDFAKKKKLKVTFILNITGGLGKRNFLYEFSPRTLEQIAYFRAPLYLDVYY